ncbi:hypothetical protein T03_16144 [Trichinella britovi]|uniref:Uncharacterized protein n=1 Tax=Trichinella britovi TaxID=45882 RepID=A0A0V1AQ32_TRIBR|nr:hypothetical protein T03_14888 [Trichinella britovi]KRY26438.1 hypothetical protein T03_16144 [Trichinella britovi]
MRHQGIHMGSIIKNVWLYLIYIYRRSFGFAALHFGCKSQLTIWVATKCLLGVLILLLSAALGYFSVLILLYRPAVDEVQSTIPPASRNGIKMPYNIFRYPHL